MNLIVQQSAESCWLLINELCVLFSSSIMFLLSTLTGCSAGAGLQWESLTLAWLLSHFLHALRTGAHWQKKLLCSWKWYFKCGLLERFNRIVMCLLSLQLSQISGIILSDHLVATVSRLVRADSNIWLEVNQEKRDELHSWSYYSIRAAETSSYQLFWHKMVIFTAH